MQFIHDLGWEKKYWMKYLPNNGDFSNQSEIEHFSLSMNSWNSGISLRFSLIQ